MLRGTGDSFKRHARQHLADLGVLISFRDCMPAQYRRGFVRAESVEVDGRGRNEIRIEVRLAFGGPGEV